MSKSARQRRKRELERQKEKKRKCMIQRSIEEQTVFGYRAEPNPHNEIPNYKAYRREPKQYPSAKPISVVYKKEQELNDSMKEREKIAQEEIERKKKRVAPLYSKGGYQYITDYEDLTTIGKKV